jgi:hypothetical protein
MLILEDSIHINAPHEIVFDFFDGMSAERYRSWHRDHHDFRWVGSPGAVAGNRFWFRETIGGKSMAKSVIFTKIEKDRYVKFVPSNRLFRLILRALSFAMEPAGDGCTFTARIEILTGPIGATLNKREFDAVRLHMKEEGENLKRLAENALF